MNLSDLSPSAVRDKLHGTGLVLKIGPFSYRIRSDIDLVLNGLLALYGEYPVRSDQEFVDFPVNLARSTGTRRWVKPQSIFWFDGVRPFDPLPLDHAFPLLEWGMNWCVAANAHNALLLHSAVIEREGCAVILPAPPGSGKSTLCAGLVHRGWRLLSDELAIISLTDASITPFGRAISLKNQSIDVMRAYAPGAVFSRVTHETSKGSVAHMKVPTPHLLRIAETAQPRWVVFPKYVAGSPARLTPRSKAHSMLELGRNSFNYMVLGLKGFEVLHKVVDASDCYDFEYSQLDDAVTVFDELVQRKNQ